MTFTSWLSDNILSGKCLNGVTKTQGHVTLSDNRTIFVNIKKLSPSVIIVPEEITKEELRILKNRKFVWNTRCDFILAGSHPRHGDYILFVELKESVSDYADDAFSDEEKKGYLQLRWAKPLFDYLLSAFNIDTSQAISENHFEIRYFLIGDRLVENLKRRLRKQGVRGRLFHCEEYMDIRVNILETKGVSYPLKLSDMISKSCK